MGPARCFGLEGDRLYGSSAFLRRGPPLPHRLAGAHEFRVCLGAGPLDAVSRVEPGGWEERELSPIGPGSFAFGVPVALSFSAGMTSEVGDSRRGASYRAVVGACCTYRSEEEESGCVTRQGHGGDGWHERDRG